MSYEKPLVALAAPILPGGLHPNVAPEKCPRPYGTYTEIVSPSEKTLDGNVPIQNSIVQIDVWAPTYAQAKACGEALATAIEDASEASPLEAVQLSRRGRFDNDTRLHGFMYEFSFWYHD